MRSRSSVESLENARRGRLPGSLRKSESPADRRGRLGLTDVALRFNRIFRTFGARLSCV
jgi:hypothetical protein